MKPFHFHPEALLEADEAAKFYEERQNGLGKRFIEVLTDTINRIKRDLYQTAILLHYVAAMTLIVRFINNDKNEEM